MSSQCHPRVLHLLLAWSAGPLGWRRARGRELGRWAGVGVGAWILFPSEQIRGWLLLELPAPGAQGWGSLQGLMFRTRMSLGIFQRGIPRSLGDWEQLDLAFPVPQEGLLGKVAWHCPSLGTDPSWSSSPLWPEMGRKQC